MEKETLFYAILAVIVLVVLVIGISKLFFTEQRGLSKAALECTYLDFVPFLCSEEDKQKLDQNNPEQIQLRKQQIDNFLDKIISTFQTCGENSKVAICKCSLEFSKLLNTDTTISKGSDGFIYLQNDQTKYKNKIENLKNLYINTPKNEIITIIPPYNSLYFHTDEYGNLIITTGSGKDMIEINSYDNEDDMNKIAIFKQGDKKGIYLGDPYSTIDCGYECDEGYLDICTKERCQEAANKRGLPCYYIDYWGWASLGGTCHGDPTKSYESILEPESNKIINIPNC